MTNIFSRNIFSAPIVNRWLAIGVMLVAATVSSGSLEADDFFVLSHLDNNEETSYLQTDGRQLVPFVTDRVRPSNLVEYQKVINGVPLHGGIVRVFMAEDGTVANVLDHSSELMGIDDTAPAVTGDAAERLVNLSLKNVAATGASSKLVLFRRGDKASLAWEVNTTLADTGQAASPTGATTVVDAQTGEFLSQSQSDTKDYYAPGVADGVYPRIVINDAIGPNGSRNYAAPFDGVASVDFGGCSGILVADDLVLSARHCGLNSGDDVRFGDDSNNPTFVTSVQSVSLPDGFGTLLDGGDVAILRLTSSVPASVATPMRLTIQQNELEGQVGAMAAYGFNGIGSQGHNSTTDGRRWGGENIIDQYGSPAGAGGGANVISTDFDNGSNGANQIPGSSSTPLQFEATTAPGDSGAPIMINIEGEWVVAGVVSGGTTPFSTFGDISWWTGTAEYESEIAALGGVFIGDESFHLDNVTVFRGTLNDGTLADVLESDDSYMTFNPGFILNSTEAPVWLIFDALLPSPSPSALALTVESQANTPGLTAIIEALNWNTGLFESIDSSAAGFNSDQVVTVDLTSASTDYVQTGSGAVLARVGWRQTGFALRFPWEVRLDQAIWTVN